MSIVFGDVVLSTVKGDFESGIVGHVTGWLDRVRHNNGVRFVTDFITGYLELDHPLDVSRCDALQRAGESPVAIEQCKKVFAFQC